MLAPGGPVGRTGIPLAAEGTFDIPEDNVLGLPTLGVFYTRVARTSSQGSDAYRPFDPSTDLFDYAPYAYLQAPVRRTGAWVMGHHAVTDEIEWFFEGLAQRRHSQQSYKPPSYNNFANGAAPLNEDGRQVIPANNFYNPFGGDVIAAFRTIVEADAMTTSQTVDVYRLLSGLRGDIDRWHWESTVTWARNEAVDRASDQLLRNEARLAVGPSGRGASGNVVCGVPNASTGVVAAADIVAGCVPLNLFGGLGPDGRRTITPAQLTYISRDLTNRGLNEQWLVDAVLSGPYGRLPAGDIDWAIGVQYRKETGQLRLDPIAAQGVIGSFGFALPERASFDAREAFVETRIPLLRDRLAAQTVEVSAGARYSRFSAFGDTTSLNGGLVWRPVAAVTLRGGYSEVFRAPGTLDLFAVQLQEIGVIDDPCGLDPSPEQQVNCERNGVPGGSYVEDLSIGTPIVIGGNPDLAAETGATWTAGVLLDLTEQLGAQFSVDYWRVALDDAIDVPGSQVIADECATTGSANACERITRAADGSISQVDARLANLSRQVTKGVDLAFSASREFGVGVLAANLSATYLEAVEIRRFDNGTTFAVAGTYDGDVAVSWPRWRVNAAADWTRGPVRVSYGVRYIDSFRECGDKNFLFAYLDDDQCRTVDARLYHDLSATLSLRSGLRLTAAIENLGDTDPPSVNRSSTANTDHTTTPSLGTLVRAAGDIRFSLASAGPEFRTAHRRHHPASVPSRSLPGRETILVLRRTPTSPGASFSSNSTSPMSPHSGQVRVCL